MKRLWMLIGLVLSLPVAWAQSQAPFPQVDKTLSSIKIKLNASTELDFRLFNTYVLGLRQAKVNNYPLKSENTVLYPLLAEEWNTDRAIMPFFKWQKTDVVGQQVRITTTIWGSEDFELYKQFFMLAGQPDRAAGPDILPELKLLKDKADRARPLVDEALATNPQYGALRAQLKALPDSARCTSARHWYLVQQQADELRQKMAKLRLQIEGKIFEENVGARLADKDITDYEAALAKRSLEVADLYRDFHGFSMLRLPEELCLGVGLQNQTIRFASSLKPMGTLVWVVEPVTRNIAGHSWQGFQLSYEITLEKRDINVIRQVGTWELGGSSEGVTAIAPSALSPQVSYVFGKGGPTEALLTGSDYTHPAPGTQMPAYANSTTDPKRAAGLKARANLQYQSLGRGLDGTSFDFQYKEGWALAAFRAKAGNFRYRTEAYPGDKYLGQTDEEWLPMGRSLRSEPILYLALNGAAPTAEEAQTRWLELSQYVRYTQAQELKLPLFEAEPWSTAAGSDLGEKVWIDLNPRYQSEAYFLKTNQADSTAFRPGYGVAKLEAEPNAQAEAELFAPSVDKNGGIWALQLRSQSPKGSPFYNQVGADELNWARQIPRGAKTLLPPLPNADFLWSNGNLKSALSTWASRWKKGGKRAWHLATPLVQVSSRLAWANQSGAMQARAYLDWAAGEGRSGMPVIPNGYSGLNPGLVDWQQMPRQAFALHNQYVRPSTPSYPDAFAALAFKAPTHIITDATWFTAYYKALPSMVRPYILPEGVLWLPASGTASGIFFAWKDKALPAGLKAQNLANAQAASSLSAQGIFQVSGANVASALGVKLPSGTDPRANWKNTWLSQSAPAAASPVAKPRKK